jgi:hypothetical protein
MDDLVVIILTLLVAGAGIIGQLKKKKQAAQSEGEPKKEKDIWDLLGEGMFPQEQVPVQHAAEEIEQEEFEPYINEQNYRFEAKNEGGKLVEEKTNLTKTTAPQTDKKIKEEFSLRKAVIYSEILNRKYK